MQATALKATRQRKPKKKVARFIRAILPLNAEGKNGVIRIVVGKMIEEYTVSRIASDFGTGFQLDKIGWDETNYHVNLDGKSSTCDCKGHLQHGHCKHCDGLQALVNHDKL
jgi:hypothetical protein